MMGKKMKELIKNRHSMSNKISLWRLYGCKEMNITPIRFLIKSWNEMFLAWVVEKLPTQMIENPDYKAEEDIEEMEEQERAEIMKYV